MGYFYDLENLSKTDPLLVSYHEKESIDMLRSDIYMKDTAADGGWAPVGSAYEVVSYSEDNVRVTELVVGPGADDVVARATETETTPITDGALHGKHIEVNFIDGFAIEDHGSMRTPYDYSTHMDTNFSNRVVFIDNGSEKKFVEHYRNGMADDPIRSIITESFELRTTATMSEDGTLTRLEERENISGGVRTTVSDFENTQVIRKETTDTLDTGYVIRTVSDNVYDPASGNLSEKIETEMSGMLKEDGSIAVEKTIQRDFWDSGAVKDETTISSDGFIENIKKYDSEGRLHSDMDITYEQGETIETETIYDKEGMTDKIEELHYGEYIHKEFIVIIHDGDGNLIEFREYPHEVKTDSDGNVIHETVSNSNGFYEGTIEYYDSGMIKNITETSSTAAADKVSKIIFDEDGKPVATFEKEKDKETGIIHSSITRYNEDGNVDTKTDYDSGVFADDDFDDTALFGVSDDDLYDNIDDDIPDNYEDDLLDVYDKDDPYDDFDDDYDCGFID